MASSTDDDCAYNEVVEDRDLYWEFLWDKEGQSFGYEIKDGEFRGTVSD